MIPEDVKNLFKQAKEDWKSDGFVFLVDHRGDSELIIKYCATPEQIEWMQQKGLSLEALKEGKYNIDDSPTVHMFYKDWNTKLGVEWFQEEDLTGAMLKSIGDNLGKIDVTGFQFEGDPKVYPTTQPINKILAAKEVMDLTKQAKDILGQWVK